MHKKKMYIWYEIDKENILTIDIDQTIFEGNTKEWITDAEPEKFLTITVETL